MPIDPAAPVDSHYMWLGFYPPAIPINQSAGIVYIGEVQEAASGPSFISLVGREILPVQLDGLQIRNVMFTNLRVVYHGGPTRLENVFFVNCIFSVDRSAPGFEFAGSVLQSATVSFRYGT